MTTDEQKLLEEIRNLLRALVAMKGCKTYHHGKQGCEICRNYARKALENKS